MLEPDSFFAVICEVCYIIRGEREGKRRNMFQAGTYGLPACCWRANIGSCGNNEVLQYTQKLLTTALPPISANSDIANCSEVLSTLQWNIWKIRCSFPSLNAMRIGAQHATALSPYT
jgi:hypothetical protein